MYDLLRKLSHQGHRCCKGRPSCSQFLLMHSLKCDRARRNSKNSQASKGYGRTGLLFTDGVSPRVAGHRKACSAGADCRDLSLVESAHCASRFYPRTPRNRVLPPSPPAREASATRLSALPNPSCFHLAPSPSLSPAGPPLPEGMQKTLSARLPSACRHADRIPFRTGGGGAQGRELGGRSQFLLGPLPDFFLIPGTDAHLVDEQPLAASGPATPGGKPRILELNRPKREKASCWRGALPCRHARGFPDPQDFRKRAPTPPCPPTRRSAPRGRCTGGKLFIM